MRNELLADGVEQYIVDTTVREHPALAELHAETSTMPGAGMQIGADQGQFMGLLARAIGAKRYLEIGVFTGYSSLAMALALPDDGRVVACDVSEEYTSVAKRYWQKAGVEKKMDLRLGPAVATLDKMIADKVEGLRHRVHRRGQGQLRRVLRALLTAGAARRFDSLRQHAVERPRRRQKRAR